MSWNEPGRGNRDPWGGGGSGNQGPPDLDEVIKKLRGKLGGVLGGKGNGGDGGDSGGSGGGGGASISGTGIAVIVGVILLIWLASGIYIVDEGNRGLELRFGQYHRTTTPGPHWHPPYPIGTVERVNVEDVRVAEVGYQSSAGDRRQKIPREALMLTQDENIIDVQLAVQYRVREPMLYQFNFRDPDRTLHQVTESALREVVGQRRMDFVLTEGRTEVAEEVYRLLTETMDRYATGLEIITVDVQDVQPPEPVQGAFEDAIMAREDEQRVINQANAYRNELVARARGEAAEIREQAMGYRFRVVADAEGESARFTALVQEYQRAPDVTRQRLFLDTMSDILGRSSKVLIDPSAGDPLLYLPLDKLRDGRQSSSASDGGDARLDPDVLNRRISTSGAADSRARGDLRSREGR